MVPRLVFLEMDRADIVTGGLEGGGGRERMLRCWRLKVDTGTASDDSEAGVTVDGESLDTKWRCRLQLR